jgi:hypothetical protein
MAKSGIRAEGRVRPGLCNREDAIASSGLRARNGAGSTFDIGIAASMAILARRAFAADQQ